jgi:hypothetical protein
VRRRRLRTASGMLEEVLVFVRSCSSRHLRPFHGEEVEICGRWVRVDTNVV